ncbi:hypothetical protein GY45DRAFT_602173 [Cubamyces sp. BRFM 1775]|nr:hypothetical protein GY45DRAFT_602173 [Cubamyces sp. BRFM 1775]
MLTVDPRIAHGKNGSLGANLAPFDGTYHVWRTNTTAASMASLPQCTATATAATLPLPSFSPNPTVRVGIGWFDASDNGQAVTSIAGCTYPDAWHAEDAEVRSRAVFLQCGKRRCSWISRITSLPLHSSPSSRAHLSSHMAYGLWMLYSCWDPSATLVHGRSLGNIACSLLSLLTFRYTYTVARGRFDLPR